ncbi:MAG: hypothetical protein ABI618_05915 [Nitrospirota bacterium]
MIFIPNRTALTPSDSVQWDQGDKHGSGSVLNDSNNQYLLADGSSLTVKHVRFFSTKPNGTNRILRIDNVLSDWVDGNFTPNDKLLYSDTQSAQDGPIIIEFNTPISAAGVNIQTSTYGEFTGVILAIDTNGLGYKFKRLGTSGTGNGTAIFLGISSHMSNIIRLEFSTTNIVENGHADFDKGGFAINHLSIAT